MEYLNSPVYSTGKREDIAVKKRMATIKSHFQEIEIVDTEKFGKCLVIDGLMQTSEADHMIYDRAILRPISLNDKNIVILGGGDGYVAEMALAINPDAIITVIDLDIEVVKACEKYLGQKVFSHKNVKLMAGDAFHFLKVYAESNQELVDGIVCDLTDDPVGGREGEAQFRDFYRNIFALSHKLIRTGGWISVQAGAAKVTGAYLDAVTILEELMTEYFVDVSREDVLIPSFSENNAFLFGKKG